MPLIMIFMLNFTKIISDVLALIYEGVLENRTPNNFCCCTILKMIKKEKNIRIISIRDVCGREIVWSYKMSSSIADFSTYSFVALIFHKRLGVAQKECQIKEKDLSLNGHLKSHCSCDHLHCWVFQLEC